MRAGALMPGAEPDRLAEETPVALEFNGISHATMLATPTDLEDFAVGFSLSEGIIDGVADLRGIDVLPQCDGIVVQIEISSACEARLKSRRRAMAGRTGCGLCGVETLPEVLRPVAPVPAGAPLPVGAVLRAMRDMRARQALHDLTGATHAAGWADASGAVALVREDVGRHNALDKLIGALARQARPAAHGVVLVSSRASFEMVQRPPPPASASWQRCRPPPRWPCALPTAPASRSWAFCATTTPPCIPTPNASLPRPDATHAWKSAI